jgi:hypothetical protein
MHGLPEIAQKSLLMPSPWAVSQSELLVWDSDMRELFRNERLMSSLLETDKGELIFSVVCGGIGMYEARIILNEEEKRRFEIEGEAFLDNLALSIAGDPECYKTRKI